MPVYILRPDETVFSVNRQVALVGFTLRGEDVRLYEENEFDKLPLTQEDIVCGGVGHVHRGLKRLGLAIPEIDSVPASLTEFAGRKIWRGRMLDARRSVERGEPLFVKPLPTQLKLFTGQPMREFADLLATAHVPDDMEVECADLTPFVSEFRTFVLNRKIVGLRHYNGDPLAFPDAGRVRSAVESFHAAPAGYALDVGVTEDGRTLVVEVNDGYAVGAYGLPPLIYAALIDARWAELRHQSADED